MLSSAVITHLISHKLSTSTLCASYQRWMCGQPTGALRFGNMLTAVLGYVHIVMGVSAMEVMLRGLGVSLNLLTTLGHATALSETRGLKDVLAELRSRSLSPALSLHLFLVGYLHIAPHARCSECM